MKAISILVLLALLVGCASSKRGVSSPPEANEPSDGAAQATESRSTHNDDEFAESITVAHEHLTAGRHGAAITMLDSVILHYEIEHMQDGVRNYSARSQVEALYYLLKGATELASGTDEPQETLVVSIIWSQAYYLRGYASIEQMELDQGVEWLGRAIALAPMNSYYLSELGHIYQTREEWQRALKTYEAAERASEFSPKEVQVKEQGRAMRGIGYVMIETGELEKARSIYENCLRLDPDDTTAKDELGYIQGLLAGSAEAAGAAGAE